MDPETAKLIAIIAATATVTSALVGAGGALFGVWLNQHGAQKLAEKTLAGQRTLAQDEARRTSRKEATRTILRAMDRRGNLASELHNAVYAGFGTDVRRIVVELTTQLPSGYAHLAIQDLAFEAALKRCYEADFALWELLRSGAEDDWRDHIGAATDVFRQAIVHLYGAAEAYWLAQP